jgi:hypothetical protein
MPTCDGSGCNKNISWKVTNTGLTVGTAEVAKFTYVEMGKAVNAVLSETSLVFTPADPPVLCLCPACWLAYAKKWGEAEKKSAEVYSPARAKTDKNGVHLQVEDAAFLKNVVVANGNGSPQAEPIVSCIVHEVMHYWSHDHSGVSAHNREKGVEWDEVICDWIGSLVYKHMFHGKTFTGGAFERYIGPYGTNNQFLVRAGKNWEDNMNLQRLYKTFIEDPQERAKLPRPVRKYFEEVSNGSAKQNAPQSPRLSRSGSQSPPLIGGFQPPPPPPTFGFQPPPPPSGGFQPPPIPGFGGPPLTGIGMGVTAPVKHGTLSRQIYDKALMLCCATWFFKGPAVTIDDYGNFAAFIDKKDTVFQKTNVFEGYKEAGLAI